MMITPLEIAEAVWSCYNSLSKAGKPRPGEWTTLAGIVCEDEEVGTAGSDAVPELTASEAAVPSASSPRTSPRIKIEVVALATGTKCVTGKDAEVPFVIVDCHAESLLKRAFKRYLISRLAKAESPVTFEKNNLHFFISQLPCGTIERYEGAPTAVNVVDKHTCDLPGGISRKPGRGVPCPRPSCVDKLAKWVRCGIQGEQLVAFTGGAPVNISSLTIGNCAEKADEFNRGRLEAALEIGGKGTVKSEDGRRDSKRLKAEADQEYFKQRTSDNFSISFCDTFRHECLTKSESSRACASAVVAWKAGDCDAFQKEVVVLGRPQGQTKKSKLSLLTNSDQIRKAISELNRTSDAKHSQFYHDKWTELAMTPRFSGWYKRSSPLNNSTKEVDDCSTSQTNVT